MSRTSKKSSTGAILSARHLIKEYRDGDSVIRVLTGAALELTRGEALAVTGKSGAGKSTLLHILGLIDSPTEGEVFLDGEDVTKAGVEVRARVRNQRFGFVFQSYHLVAELTALENVLLPAMMTGALEWARSRGASRSRAEDLLGKVGLAERLHHRPAKLSGGERQRVAIARALMNEPEVLFCDEPTGNLDESTSESIHSLLRRLNKDTGVTQVIVTHDRELASQADRVVRIEGGRIVA
ncbi:MAG: ABC transporter ATP-binding protein [Planctomycetota bacterium]|jgi:lipoprotein-releasing system ATP-binding protein